MAGPYDYSINIPQPPAQNFLQSLLGIQQLKGLQQQGELAQQQAAIQQQQAGFAQQMQPLQMQAEQERIKQIQAATGASNQSAAESKYRLDRQKELSSTLEWISKPENFTVDNLQNAAVRLYDVVPQLLVDSAKMKASMPAEGQLFLDKAAEGLLFASVTGKKDDALAVLDENIKAAENSDNFKQYIPKLQELRKKFDENPEQTKALAGIAQVALRGDKGKAVIEQMGELAKTKKAEAETKVEEAKLTPGGEKISDKQQDTINTLTSEAVDARINVAGATDAVTDLLNFAETNPKEFSKGTAASIDKFFLDRFGDTTKAQNLRASVQPFVTKDWMAKAAGIRGALSEKEGARFDKGAPKVETAGPEELLSWLRIVQKVELVDADKKDINAAWQQNARSLQAKAPVEFEVAGIKVKPGDSFQQTVTKVQAGYRKKNQEDILADAARLKRIKDAQKSGRSPAFGRFDVMGAGPQQQQQPAVAPNQATISSDRQSLLNRYR
jgi:hypothetical protein